MSIFDKNNTQEEMFEYKFRFIGEQELVYERLNAYESDDVYYADIEFEHPISKKITRQRLAATGRKVNRMDVIKYIEDVIERHYQYQSEMKKEQRFGNLLYKFQNDRWNTSLDETRELIDLFLDTHIRSKREM